MADYFLPPPPWLLPLLTLHFTPTCKALPSRRKKLALDTIVSVSATIITPHHLFGDGSVQADSTSGCTVFSPDAAPPREAGLGVGCRLSPTPSFFSYTVILDAVSFLCERRLSGVVICDSQAALNALASSSPVCRHLVNRILTGLTVAHDQSLVIEFIWIPSHVSLSHSDTVDRLTKAACGLPTRDAGPVPSFKFLRIRI